MLQICDLTSRRSILYQKRHKSDGMIHHEVNGVRSGRYGGLGLMELEFRALVAHLESLPQLAT